MINVRCEVETVSEVLQRVESLIPEAQLRERRSRQLIWHVKPNLLQISTLFQRMEAARKVTPMVREFWNFHFIANETWIFLSNAQGRLFHHPDHTGWRVCSICTFATRDYWRHEWRSFVNLYAWCTFQFLTRIFNGSRRTGIWRNVDAFWNAYGQQRYNGWHSYRALMRLLETRAYFLKSIAYKSYARVYCILYDLPHNKIRWNFWFR